ncbi:hypothetical protein TUN199_10189 [Pyrenophora tritici-repentis]|nr:hypothetical protein A1F99_057440 [Pyrenophora tritici-repentis]KAI0571062.1 hypothetical protein Alg215_10651 [Pyrenophora tritici-repentis]KAI0573300.1 hypothetical protein Alg130_10153 [Pyrenophora tritici-repentis]KAI0605629.1 hypothetical protein TUN205_10128 [Pyrenophora tritici-repentis]KAI0617823.1 hypothetical protein TUN199_10189 [Pyrenophora tritici-repentis]
MPNPRANTLRGMYRKIGDVVAYILRGQYCDSKPCSPVQYGQLVEKDLKWLQPTQHEMAKFEDDINCVSSALHTRVSMMSAGKIPISMPEFSFPTHLTQADELPLAVFDAFTTVTQSYLHSSVEEARASRRNGPRWLDFGQFLFNPYLLEI